jgi:hypothetical protein
VSGNLIGLTPQFGGGLQPYHKCLSSSPTFSHPRKYHIMAETTQVPDDTEIFKQLESYPWEKDKEFQVSLYILQFIISLGIPNHVYMSFDMSEPYFKALR